jgi:hypothetical protein
MGIDATTTVAGKISAYQPQRMPKMQRFFWIEKKGGSVMKTSLLGLFIWAVTGGLVASPAMADDNTLVKFSGGIAVNPVSSGVGTATTATTVNRNIVRGVQPPGQIWRIKDLKAEVQVNGHIEVDGRGLLLAGGNNIGTNANQSVRARLFCGTAVHESVLVPLEANGDFQIDDILAPVSPTVTPVPPNPCDTPVLLIVNSGGSWFAAGIPDLDKHH